MADNEVNTVDDLIEWVTSSLPCYGIVSKRCEPGCDDFWYLALPEPWHRAEEILINHAKSLYQYDKNLKTSTFKLIKSLKEQGATTIPNPEQATFFRCPGHVGPHISIGKHTLGQKVNFTVVKTMRYGNQKIGSASTFDSEKYVADWIALRVELDVGMDVKQVSSPHISIAAFGFSSGVNVNKQMEQKGKRKGK
jgi:hypothetical protein